MNHPNRRPRSPFLRLNRATNDLYCRLTHRPHHFEHYKRLVSDATANASTVVHLGAGKLPLSEVCEISLAGKTIIAIEPDLETLTRNPSLFKICATGDSIPLADTSVDAVVCEYVVEHLENPERVMLEIHRVLRPGGRFVFVTPNAWSYSAIITRATSQRFHDEFLARLMQLGASINEKPCPTVFRMNTRAQIEGIAKRSGLVVRDLFSGVDHPTYTYPFLVLHQLATMWHFVLDRFDILEPLRISWVCVLERPVGRSLN